MLKGVRRSHRLKPNKGRALPSQCIYFDCETSYDDSKKEGKQQLRLAVADWVRYDRGAGKVYDEEGLFYSSSDFWDWVEGKVKEKGLLYLFAHNIDFDWGAINGFSELYNRGWELDWWALGSNIWILRYRKGRAAILVLDSLQYFPFSIKQLGERLGLPKGKMPKQDESNGLWADYCKRDVEILRCSMESLFSFIYERDLGDFSYSISGQAFRAYRHRFLEDSIYIHNFEPVLEDERSAYHGGRTEAFFIGKVPESPIYYVDVNSMYPSVMRDHNYPTRYIGTLRSPTVAEVEEAIKRYSVILVGEAEVDSPALPYRDEKLIFPIGHIKGAFSTPEVEWLLLVGGLLSIQRLHIYRSGDLFSSYVRYFWGERKGYKRDGDLVGDLLCKRFLNSLYGKFGQRNPIIEEVRELRVPIFDRELMVGFGDERSYWRWTIAGKVYEEVGREWAKDAFPAIAAHVTAYGRMKLFSLMEKAGRENVYYVDTDSLMVNSTGFERLREEIEEGELGSLSLKGIYSDLKIWGAKDYELDGKLFIKGVPKSAEEVKEGKYQFTSFEKVRTRILHGHPDGVYQQEKTKVLSRRYDKGEVLADGHVVPWRL